MQTDAASTGVLYDSAVAVVDDVHFVYWTGDVVAEPPHHFPMKFPFYSCRRRSQTPIVPAS